MVGERSRGGGGGRTGIEVRVGFASSCFSAFNEVTFFLPFCLRLIPQAFAISKQRRRSPPAFGRLNPLSLRPPLPHLTPTPPPILTPTRTGDPGCR